MSGSLTEAFGDFTRAGIADVGDTYQEILMSHASTSEPQGLTGDTVITHDPEPEAPMNDAQLQQLIDSQPEQQPAPPSADYVEPDIG